MIDTIRIRINDLLEHEHLVRIVQSYKIQGVGVTQSLVEEENQDWFLKPKIYNDAHTFHDTGRTKISRYFAKIPSYNYEIAMTVDYGRDCIFIEFSVPKFLYATNIFMLSPSVAEAPHVHLPFDLETRMKRSYRDLKNFLPYFFEKTFPNAHIDRYAVVLDRIDYCYNQLMDSKQDALDYINQQTRVHKKGLRNTSSGYKIYMGGIHYVTRNWTFKIYHKGTEFAIHDKKQLKKFNVKNIDSLQNFADRMVRYELSVRSVGLSYIWKNHIVRYKSEKNKRLHVAATYLKNNGTMKFKEKYKKQFKTQKYWVQFWEATNNYLKWLYKKESFLFFKTDVADYVYYDNALHERMVHFFIRDVRQYEVVYNSALMETVDRICKNMVESSNNRKKLIKQGHLKAEKNAGYGISVDKILGITRLLNEHTMEELKTMKLVTKRTLRLYEKFLASNGINGYVLNERYIHAKWDMQEYFFEMSCNYHIFETVSKKMFYSL